MEAQKKNLEQQWLLDRLEALSVKEQAQLGAAIISRGQLAALPEKTGEERELEKAAEAAAEFLDELVSMGADRKEMAERLQKLRRKAVSVPKSGKCSAALRSSPVPHWSAPFSLVVFTHIIMTKTGMRWTGNRWRKP